MTSFSAFCLFFFFFFVCFFFFNDTATTEIYTLSLHDALPILRSGDLIVTKTAVPNPADPNGAYADGETAEWLVSVFNNGDGGTFAVLLRSEEHTSELQSHSDLVCRLLLEKKKIKIK